MDNAFEETWGDLRVFEASKSPVVAPQKTILETLDLWVVGSIPTRCKSSSGADQRTTWKLPSVVKRLVLR